MIGTRTFRSLVMATLLAVPATARARPPKGTICELKDGAKLFFAPRGKGKMVVIEKGDWAQVIEASAPWTRVRTRGHKGYMKAPWLQRICKVLDEPPPGFETAIEAKRAELEVAAEPPPANEPTVVKTAPADGAAPEAFGETYKIKVAVMDLRGSGELPEELVASLTAVVPETLDALGPFKAISSQDIVQMLQFESQQQMLGCDDAACIAEIGGALGADFMVTGSITKAADTVVIQLTLMNIREGKAKNRVSRRHQGDAGGLFDEVAAATKQLVREILGERSGQLQVSVSEEGATISIDGSIVGVSPIRDALNVAGGSHTLSVEKTGFVLYRQDFTIFEDQQTPLDAVLLPSAEFKRNYREDAERRRWVAYAGMGGGGVMLLTAAGLIAGTQGESRRLDRKIRAYNDLGLRDSARYQRLGRREKRLAGYDTAATVLMSVGVVAAGAGVLLYLTGSDPNKYDAGISVGAQSPALSVGPQGVAVGTSF